MRRLSAVLALVPLVLVSACSGDAAEEDGAPPDDLATDLAAGLELTAAAVGTDKEEDVASGAGLADVAFVGQDVSEVAEEYVEVVAGMNGIAPTVEGEVSGDAITLTWSWPVVEGEEPWTYETTAEVGEDGDSWAVVWDRTVVEPSLKKNDTLEATTVPARRGEIRGAGGKVLVTERPVFRYGIDRVQVSGAKAAASARELAALVGIDVAPYVAAVKAAGDRAFVEAITYREDEVPPAVRRTALDIEGALAMADEIALAPTREFAAPILGRVGPVTAEMIEEDPDAYEIGDIVGISGLQQRYDEQLRGSDGRVVEAANPNRARGRELFRVQATDGETLALTLDERLQTAAESLLADVGPASAIVALRPSDGSILAAANGPGTEGLNHATYGQFAPGSTFKIVSSLALLRSGLEPGSTLPCTATTNVDGKQFKNYDDYPSSALGDVPFSTAVAQSCNTAFISQRGELGKGDLAGAAAALGLGIDHDLGFPAYFGQVPPPASETEAAADLIGQGKILASPMVMATVIASVQEGAVVVPRLVEQVDVEAPDVEALTRTEADQLRGMLRQVVTEGSGSALADVPGAPVIAKTGTAEFERDGRIETHAWMVAAQGDLAVAVFVELGESGSQTAGPILEEFLRAAG
ncbi:cell division protein FtsI/penicillin-binding protein 2 [Nocardioides thalensis]|uniref:Beta-lactamase n=1 Tax=Nocardioides thalensis TaxID=1914755 RepID=A0A853C9Y3_9ACTN|nr:penicillin-binding transpeptidase domain-containing protein [Nocardioides thalensis]NYJ03462.1 cell division protein FtsI/penicillin-binding protein 2 [Nocardioides thalensis]